MATDTAVEPRPHKATFSLPIFEAVRPWLDAEHARRFPDGDGRLRVYDCFAGTGGVHWLHDEYGDETWGGELEPEWAAQHPRNVVADALAAPFRPGAFHVLFTSPCLEQSHRILTSDLRWVAAGDVEVGDEVMSFDENPGPAHSGRASRRRWKRATVVRSVPRSVDCLRVILANGDEVITTPEHPWLAYRYGYRGAAPEWVTSKDLAGVDPLPGRGGRGRRGAFYVARQMDTWSPRSSFDAGWLSGMFDGEGSLSLGAHGSPKMTLCQAEGPVLDRAETLMSRFGYEPNRIMRKDTPAHRQKIGTLYVTGGFPGMLRALGELRPGRLLSKWETLDVSTRTVEATKVQVVAVEPAGRRDIQEIETSAGTYFGEGYMMHNCYANRFADTYDGRDGSTRHSYRIWLGRMPTDGSAAVLQWGDAYRDLHERILVALLAPKGPLADDALVVVNMSNHLRTLRSADGQLEMHVVEWWATMLSSLGLRLLGVVPIGTNRLGLGANSQARAETEFILVYRRPPVLEVQAARRVLGIGPQGVLPLDV